MVDLTLFINLIHHSYSFRYISFVNKFTFILSYKEMTKKYIYLDELYKLVVKNFYGSIIFFPSKCDLHSVKNTQRIISLVVCRVLKTLGKTVFLLSVFYRAFLFDN